jgi:flagellar motor switch protein FliM
MAEVDDRSAARAIEKMVHSQPGREGHGFSLQPVLERLTLGLGRSLRRLAGGQGRVALQTTSSVKVSQYRDSILAGSVLATFGIDEGAAPGLLVLDPSLTNAAIDMLLGGGQMPEAELAAPRAYTPADQAVARGLMRLITDEVGRALTGRDEASTGRANRLLQTETDPQLMAIAPADSPLTVARFEAALGPGGCGGTFDLVLPDSCLESLRRISHQPQSPPPSERVPPQGRLGPISDVSFALHAVVDRFRLPLLELANWEAGTWIPLVADAEQPVTIYCERNDGSGLGQALFAGRLGSSRGRRAVRIADVMSVPPQAHDLPGSASS